MSLEAVENQDLSTCRKVPVPAPFWALCTMDLYPWIQPTMDKKKFKGKTIVLNMYRHCSFSIS
jgi:hypothetical protein